MASDTEQPVASSSTKQAQDRPKYREPKYLRMVKPMVFDIAYTDCPDARIPSHVILPRHFLMANEGSRGSDEETVVAPKSDEAHRRYWKLVIGTYVMHYGKLIYNLDPKSLYRLRKFPAGYELYARPRLSGSQRTPDQYLFGFDRKGERVIMFDSPYAFVLHAISLCLGSTRSCPCKVCDDDMRQKDIRKVLREAAPFVTIPSVRQWKKRLGNENGGQRASPAAQEASPPAIGPPTGEELVKSEPVEDNIKAEVGISS